MRILHYFLIVFMTLALASPLAAQETEEPESYVKIRLLPALGEIGPGEDVWIAIEQSIYPHWHTYWKNPGDSGAPPRIEWTLPEGFTIGGVEWPAPHKMPFGPLLNYGYENNVILLQKLTAPDILPAGPIVLKANIEILVCKEICIPEFGEYEVTLNGLGAQLENNLVYINEARKKMPGAVDWKATYEENGNAFRLTIPEGALTPLSEAELETLEFFPEDWGLVSNPAPTTQWIIESGVIVLEQERGERSLGEVDTIQGVVAYTDKNKLRHAFAFSAEKNQEPGAATAPPVTRTTLEGPAYTGLMQAMVFALIGGLILNLMPCVFPVLSIKALSLVKISEKHPGSARLHGIAYTAGVVLSFLVVAGILIALQTGGSQIGWGFQLQNPVVVTLLAYLLFVIGLNLSGVFEFGSSFGNLGSQLTKGQNLNSSFFTGILATLVATPCTAPFMGVAVGYALVQPPIVALSVFAALGFGLALPYLLLSFIPALQKLLPKPGKWMDIFRQLLAFPMFASAAWLVWVLSLQAGDMGVLGALLGMVFIGFALWLLQHKPKKKYWQAKTKILAVVSVLIAFAFLPAGEIKPTTHVTESPAFGETFSQDRLSELLLGDDPIFVEMTAAWCITCKVNHAVAINIDATKALFAGHGVHYLIGDWTNQDPVITDYLNSFGRSGVPIYVFYGARDADTGQRPDPQVLPQVLTPSIVKDTITGS